MQPEEEIRKEAKLCASIVVQYAKKLQLNPNAHQNEQLTHYFSLLLSWNPAKNLLSRQGNLYEELIDHSLDCLRALHATSFPLHSVLDWGSGGGFPGIIWAIFLPKTQFLLLDRRGAKARFLKQAVYELSLENTRVTQKELQTLLSNSFPSSISFDTIISRAVAPIDLTFKLMKPWLLGSRMRTYQSLLGPNTPKENPKGLSSHWLELPEEKILLLQRATLLPKRFILTLKGN